MPLIIYLSKSDNAYLALRALDFLKVIFHLSGLEDRYLVDVLTELWDPLCYWFKIFLCGSVTMLLQWKQRVGLFRYLPSAILQRG